MHYIYHEIFPVTTDTKKIQDKLNRKAIRESDTHCGLDNPIRFIDVVCENEEEAKKYIKAEDNGWYDNLAVKFYHRIPSKNKKYLSFKEKLKTLTKESYDLNQANYEIKTAFSTCKYCKSRFNTEHYKGKYCPVCHEDIRPKSLLNKINKLEGKIREINQKLNNVADKELCWLVKIEYHV